MTDSKEHHKFIQQAIAVAKKQGTPYAALLVNEQNECISAYNTTKADGPIAHAEINLLRKMNELPHQGQKLRLYSTAEPCPMCMGAIVWAGIEQVIYGASIEEISEFHRQISINAEEVANKSWLDVEIIKGIEKEQCIALFK